MPNYYDVTEIPGLKASKEQFDRLIHRYKVACHFAINKRVLEVACGAGLGLGFLKDTSKRVVGGDYTSSLLQIANSNYGKYLDLTLLNATNLPFKDNSFDVIILFEALYYLKDVEAFIKESHRVLQANGTLIIATVNKDWKDFNPSPLSTKYFSSSQLNRILVANGFKASLYGSFPTNLATISQKIISLIKRMAINLNLVPNSMKGKQILKRIFFGRLIEIPENVDVMSTYMDDFTDFDSLGLQRIPPNEATTKFKVIYAISESQTES